MIRKYRPLLFLLGTHLHGMAGVVVPLISLHAIAIILPAVIITNLGTLMRIAMNIRSILAQGILAIMTLLPPHLLRRAIIAAL